MPSARTVLGDIPPQQLGITYPHEHVTIGYTGARQSLGNRFDREGLVKHICDDLGKAMRAHGVKTIVDVTFPEVGRDVDILQEVSRRLNVNIIACTGHYTQEGGFPFYWNLMDVEKFEERFTREITEGVGPDNVKCGVIKIAMSNFPLPAGEEKAFRAAAMVSKKLGVSICVHTSGWTTPADKPHGLAALELLVSEGADPSRIQMGHMEGTQGNMAQLLEVARRGVYLAFDVVGRNPEQRDPIRTAMVRGLIAAGYGHRILLSMDHTSGWVPQPRPERYATLDTHFTDIHDYLPKLRKAGVTERQLEKIFVDNPRELFPF
ncbi:MAG: hypothetical protein HYY31_06825 [Chloroflexi bacterium]|nr:hypothetical protein [Chloroflexota bacterium]